MANLQYDEMLIQLVRDYPVIYDMTREDYKSTNLKSKAWQEIFKKLIEMGFVIDGNF